MLQGIRLKAHPTSKQKQVLSQWMGCARFVWNAKCEENRYYRTFARKYCPIGTRIPLDQKASHFKSSDLSPWLSQCPSQILRNSAANWYNTYQKHLKGLCGRPKRKRKSDLGSVHLTRELFRFEHCDDGVTRLFIGSKTRNIGYLSIKNHRPYREPNSIYIRKQAGQYFVSFCFDDGLEELLDDKAHLAHLKDASPQWLERYTVGIDRGVEIPVQAGENEYDFTEQQSKNKERSAKYITRLQRRLARQRKGSNRRNRTKQRIAAKHRKIANIRQDFCHKTSRKIVDSDAKVIIFEDLKTRSMTGRAKPKQDSKGRYLPNRRAQKSGLNRKVLDVAWHQIEHFTQYKSRRAAKAVFKVPAAYTSQECASCGYTHSDNRPAQARFVCQSCGHIDNADRNAAMVIKRRGISLLTDSGTELLGKGIPVLSTGRGARRQSLKAKSLGAVSETSVSRLTEASKKKRLTPLGGVAGLGSSLL